MAANARIRPIESVTHFAITTDVLICGYGGAGAAAHVLRKGRRSQDSI